MAAAQRRSSVPRREGVPVARRASSSSPTPPVLGADSKYVDRSRPVLTPEAGHLYYPDADTRAIRQPETTVTAHQTQVCAAQPPKRSHPRWEGIWGLRREQTAHSVGYQNYLRICA